MRIMVMGEGATGKSTFARTLAKKLKTPVIHLEEITDAIGKENPEDIRKAIRAAVDEDDWVMDGNVFYKDVEYRLKRTDYIFLFASPRLVAAYRLIRRQRRVARGIEWRVGALNNTTYRVMLPWVLWRFSKRKKAVLKLARQLNVPIIRIKHWGRANEFLTDEFVRRLRATDV
jgi:adenylate kinase family enzyme